MMNLYKAQHLQKPKSKTSGLSGKYIGASFKMAAIISLSVWGGQKLDESFEFSQPWMTISLSLLGITAAIFSLIKDLKN